MEATGSFQILIVVYQTTRHHTPEDSNHYFNIIIKLHLILGLALVVFLHIFRVELL